MEEAERERQMGWGKDEIGGMGGLMITMTITNFNGQVVRRQTADGEEHMVYIGKNGDAVLVEKQVGFAHSS